MKLLMTKVRTMKALGLRNVASVLLYRLGLRLGFHPVLRIKPCPVTGGDFYRNEFSQKMSLPVPSDWTESFGVYFGHKRQNFSLFPDWLLNPFSGYRFSEPLSDWWTISDFDPQVGDIKGIWEASRFDWVVLFAQKALCGDSAQIVLMNRWLHHWLQTNLFYKGPNWKCGQEASLRVLNLCLATLLLDQHRNCEKPLLDLIFNHLQRIAPTTSYAKAQNNNHGTSEAAALYVGGALLKSHGYGKGKSWFLKGKKLLENRVRKLIQEDGSFSQYSMNYHRMVLDSLSLVEVFRRKYSLEGFSKTYDQRVSRAVSFLYSFVDAQNGFVPNIGANDGAQILKLSPHDYRDFRPSVHLAATLFLDRDAFGEFEPARHYLMWLGVKDSMLRMDSVHSTLFSQGGYALLLKESLKVILKFPSYRFRPSQSDVFHLDVWKKGKNILLDAGSFSYFSENGESDYFVSAKAHNTVEFDLRDHMPKLSRFLYGSWVKTQNLEFREKEGRFSACYEDAWGAVHQRTVRLVSDDVILVEDDLSGSFHRAILRWRLPFDSWKLDGHKVKGELATLSFAGLPVGAEVRLSSGIQSLYYQKKEPVIVIEVLLNQACQIQTEVSCHL